MDFFEETLKDIGRMLGTTLKPDNNHTCAISINDKIVIHIELDKKQEMVVVGCTLGVLTPGHMRVDFLKEALKANAPVNTPTGIFAYSVKSQSLLLFLEFAIQDFRSDFLLALFPNFAEKAQIWAQAIKDGALPEGPTENDPGPGMFGLRP